jgi:hypothetical protein
MRRNSMIKFTSAAAMGLAAAGMLASAAPVAAAPAFDVAPQSHVAGVTDISANQYRDRDWRERRGYRRDHRDRGYSGQAWRGRDGRYYCRRNDGTTGLLIGGAVGGLAGNAIAGRGDRTLGTILGVAGGALLGREIDRSGSRCR